MKKVLLFFLFVTAFMGSKISAQTYYETAFTSGDVRYDALLIFYDDNDILVRTRYNAGEYKVAEYTATASTVTLDDGSECYFIDGTNASIVFGSDGSYSADNYIFYADDKGWGDPYAVDENGLSSADPQSHMTKVLFWREVDPSEAFTQEYVYNYFQKDEALYATLLSYHRDNLMTTSSANGGVVGEWKVFMSKGTGYGLQSWMTRKEWPKADIKSYWDKGKHITDVGYGNGLWMITMSEKSGFDTQSWNHGVAWPNDWIETKWKDKKHITEVAYGGGKWSVVMSSGTGITDQKYIVSKEWPKQWLADNWKTSTYHISSIAYGAGHWVLVLSNKPGYSPAERIRAGADFPASDVAECKAEGYSVKHMTYGDEWVLILHKDGATAQVYDENSAFPKSFVSETWNDGYSISEAAYSYREDDSFVVLNFTGTASTSNGSNNTIAAGPTQTTTNTPSNSNPTTTTTIMTAVPDMHVVIVANTKVPDIGTSCEVDKNNILDEFSDVADALGIEMKKYVIDGENLTKAKVNQTLSNLNPKPNDIVVFAYTGHGYRFSNQSSSYPMMALFYSRFDSPSNNNSLNLEDVYKKIVAKGARLNIVMGDCCNNDIGMTSREGGGSLASRSFSRGSIPRLRKLFFESKGNVIAAAAVAGETSCGSRVSGGYFLNAFFSALDKEVSLTNETAPSWDAIMNRSMKSATYKTQNLNGCDAQHGVFKSSIPR